MTTSCPNRVGSGRIRSLGSSIPADSLERASLSFVRWSCGALRGAEDALGAAKCNLFGWEWRRAIVVEPSCLGFRDGVIGERLHDDDLRRSRRARDADLVAHSDRAVSFARDAVHLDFPALAGALRLGPRLEKT